MINRYLTLAAIFVAASLFLFAAPTLRADERLKGIACRSVHLAYTAPEGTAFYNEVTIDQSAVGTYFMVCGWDKGYFGLQELGNGRKLLLFSVWDSGQNDPRAVAEERRTKLLYKDDQVRIGRFGGEGTGGQSFFDYPWKNGETYRCLVTSKVDGERTEYAGYFYVPVDKAWKHLVTFSTITGGKQLRGYYSFIEDFKRDRALRRSLARLISATAGSGMPKVNGRHCRGPALRPIPTRSQTLTLAWIAPGFSWLLAGKRRTRAQN